MGYLGKIEGKAKVLARAVEANYVALISDFSDLSRTLQTKLQHRGQASRGVVSVHVSAFGSSKLYCLMTEVTRCKKLA